MNESGRLEKLLILSFLNNDLNEKKAVDRFEAFVNPAEISLSYEHEFDAGSGHGSTASPMQFKRVKPGDMTLSFFLDGTNVAGRREAEFQRVDSVQEMVRDFQRVTGYDGDIHRPRYLKVVWGTLTVKRCVLKSATIAYKLFRANGVPLRAVISAVFTDSVNDRLRVAMAQDNSTDLTHERLVRGGETLVGLCESIYGDATLAPQVARFNGLDRIRGIVPGTRLFFPPLEK